MAGVGFAVALVFVTGYCLFAVGFCVWALSQSLSKTLMSIGAGFMALAFALLAIHAITRGPEVDRAPPPVHSKIVVQLAR